MNDQATDTQDNVPPSTFNDNALFIANTKALLQERISSMYRIVTYKDYIFVCYYSDELQDIRTFIANNDLVPINSFDGSICADVFIQFGEFNRQIEQYKAGLCELPENNAVLEKFPVEEDTQAELLGTPHTGQYSVNEIDIQTLTI